MDELPIPIRRPRRVLPIDREFYKLPKTVGVVQSGDHEPNIENPPITQHFTIQELFDELWTHNIRAASIYTKQIPWILSDGWDHPYVDTIVVRPSSIAWTYEDTRCDGVIRTVWSEYPIAKYAEFLYSTYPDLDKVIIFTDWEIDHVLRGISCSCEENLSWEREFFVRRWIARQSKELKRVRSRYPDAKLRIMYGPTINTLPCNNNCEDSLTASEIIGSMIGLERPDVVLVSRWCGDKPLTPSLEWVSETTGFSPARIIVAEIGVRQEDNQREKLYDWVNEAWEFGVRTVFIWIWKQTWCGSNGRGMWEIEEPCNGRVYWGNPAPGYYAIQELNEEWRNR